MGISKCWGKAVVVAGCLGVMTSVAHAGYDENVGAATDSSSSNMGGSMNGSMAGMSRSDMRMRNAQMLIRTLSEEKTEINSLAAQREMFLRMGGTENRRIARLWLRWINEHKAGGPTFMRLIRRNGGDPMEARILKAPPLGTREQMLMATHRDHMAAVMTSQMRFNMTMSPSIKAAMHKRANLARKHLRQMTPFHRGMMMNGNMNNDMNNSGMSGDMGGMNQSSTDNSSMDNSSDNTTTTTTTTDTTSSTSVGTPDTSSTDGSMDDSTTTSSTDTTTSTNATDGNGATDATGTMSDGTADTASDTGGLSTGTNDASNGTTNDGSADTGGLTTGTNDAGDGTMNGQ